MSNERGRHAAKAERRQKAVDLRILGMSYRQIATTLGVSERTAYLDVQDGVAMLDKLTATKAERVRDMELLRLDRLTAGLAPQAMSGDVAAVKATVKIMERRAKLLGIDAPTKIRPVQGEGENETDAPLTFTLDFGRGWQGNGGVTHEQPVTSTST